MSEKGWKGLGVAAAIVLLLVAAEGPLMAGQNAAGETEKRVCLDCHRQPNINTNEGVQSSKAFCNDCHARPDCRRTVDGKDVPLQVSAETFNGNPHQYVACIHCHTDVARSPHRTAIGGQCRDCHTAHGEGTAHAPHLRIDCQACHFKHKFVRLDETDNRVKLAHMNAALQPIGLVDHGLDDAGNEQSCRRCHQPQNTVGAPAAVLPAKSLLCVVCHPSSLGVGHPIFWVALITFLGGIFLMVRFWFVGSVQGEEKSLHRKISLSSDAVWQTIFSKKVLTVLRVVVLDIILQRRILKNSVQRWSLHSLIFLAILIRFALSLLTGLMVSIDPDGRLALVLIDKNNPFTAFTYDFLGLCIFLGVLWAVIQRLVVKPAHVKTEIEDNITLGILGGLVILGFIAEAARILMTQLPAEVAMYAFVGYPLSEVLAVLPVDWRSVYPYLWYSHAIIGAVFVAYLPFGKLKHIFNVPLTHVLEEVSGIKKEQRV
ncbi:MAG: respiratory nitrate reductase subunit gamma [Desulfobacterales bacterium]